MAFLSNIFGGGGNNDGGFRGRGASGSWGASGGWAHPESPVPTSFVDFATGNLKKTPEIPEGQYPALQEAPLVNSDWTPQGGTGGGGGAAQTGDADEVAYWQDQINNLQRLLQGTQSREQQGLSSITDSYNSARNRTQQGYNTQNRNLNTQQDDTTRDKVDALNRSEQQGRSAAENLRRLFGLAGGGVSSAAQILAPTAVNREVTKSRTDTNQRFGRNLRDLDFARADATTQFTDANDDLDRQKKDQTRSFLEGIFGLRNDLNSQIGDASVQKGIAGGQNYSQARSARTPFQNRINQNLSASEGLFEKYRNPVFKAAEIMTNAPNLSQYVSDPLRIGQNVGQNLQQIFAPAVQRRREDER